MSDAGTEPAPWRSAVRRLRWRNGLRGALRLALNVALPRLCPSCRETVGDDGLCAACWSKLSLIAPPYCDRLGIPFTYDPGPGLLSMEAIANPPAYDRARAAVRYDDVARTLVHALKYADRLDLAPTMGRWMARAGRELLEGADTLVPVPLHWRRLWSRRFNQSALLAGAISEISGVPIADAALKRVKRYPAAGGTVESRARRQRARRIPGPARTQGRGDGQTPGADRRRADLRRHQRCLRAGAAAGRRPKRRRGGVRPGCGRSPAQHHIERPAWNQR